MKKSAPIRKNSRHVLKIKDVTNKGFGVGKVDGFTVFVEGALSEEKTLVHIVKTKQFYAYGKLIETLEPSPDRVESPCSVSHQCGGCQWLFCDYEATLQFKTKVVSETLKRLGEIKDPPVLDCIGMTPPFRYRNKAVFPVAPYHNEKGFAIGMYAARSHRLIPVKDCLLQHEAHVDILDALEKHMDDFNIPPYDETSGKGLVRFIIIRTSFSTGEIMVVLVLNGKKISGEAELAAKFQTLGATTVLINENTASSNFIFGNNLRTLTGSGFITETLGDIRYRISPKSFFQVNSVQADILYKTAVQQSNLDDARLVLDAHVGAGGVLLHAAKKRAQGCEFVGIDIVPEAISDACYNAEANGLTNMRFICGPAEEEIEKLIKKSVPDTVFLDPPRKGCDKKLLESILAAGVKNLVYISCDPATLARDIKLLASGGYNLFEVQPIDMFPFTGKVEVSCRLELGTSSGS